jgi:hypothetical protein
MPIELTRDFAMYAAVFGFFGLSWFGWAQENPPKSWRVPLGIGSAISLLIAAAGIYLAVTHWSDATALDRNASRTFGIIVGIEFATAGIGAGLLAWRNKKQYIAPWVAFVVGAHFLPLVWVFQDNWLYLLAGLAMAAPVLAVFLAKKMKVEISAVTGALMGVVLVVFGLRGLALFFW